MERLADLTAQLKAAPPAHCFAKIAWAYGKARNGGGNVLETLHRWRNYPEVERFSKAAIAAGSTAAGDWGSSMTGPGSVFAEWIELTNRSSIWGPLTQRAVRLPFNTRAIVAASPTSAAFVRPGGPIPAGSLSLGDTTTLAMFRIGALALFTRELFDQYNAAVQANVTDRLTVSMARGLDTALLDPDSAGVAEETPASLTNGIAPVGLFGATAATALSSIETLLQALVTGGSDLSRALIAMHPSTALTLSMMHDSGGGQTFPRLTATGGDVAGVPVYVTASAQRSGSPPEKLVVAIDCARIVYADDGAADVQASNVAALQADDAPTNDSAGTTATNMVSMLQTHSTALKTTRCVNFERAHSSAVAWMTCNY